jgi:hypothetical protein
VLLRNEICPSHGGVTTSNVVGEIKSIDKVILEKLTVVQVVKKVSAFIGTRKLINVFTRALQIRDRSFLVCVCVCVCVSEGGWCLAPCQTIKLEGHHFLALHGCLFNIFAATLHICRDSSVGIATGYGMDDRMIGVRFSAGARNFFLRHHVQTGSWAHPASYTVGTGVLSLGIKRPGREADQSPPHLVSR